MLTALFVVESLVCYRDLKYWFGELSPERSSDASSKRASVGPGNPTYDEMMSYVKQKVCMVIPPFFFYSRGLNDLRGDPRENGFSTAQWVEIVTYYAVYFCLGAMNDRISAHSNANCCLVSLLIISRWILS